MNSRELKKQLRLEALARRDALSPQWRIERSFDMAALADSLDITPGTIVSGFWPIRSEVDIRPLMYALMDRGARLCLPAIINKTTIVFRELSRGEEMIDMGFGTYGPHESAEELDPAVMLVPLAAFDHLGDRIGYGAGFYDRAISKLHARNLHPRLIGIAFDCQLVPDVPAEDHDVRLHHLLSESGLRRFPLSL